MDEFTFPNAVPRGLCKLPAYPRHQLGLSSPPPWFVTVADDEGAPWGGGEHGEEEKMDMLWEDFNEELTRTPPVCPLSPLHKGELMMMKDAWFDDNGGVGLVVASTEKRGRHPNAGRVARRRRWSLLLMLRLLKKLLLVNKSRNQRTVPI